MNLPPPPRTPFGSLVRRESSEVVARRYGSKLAFACLLCIGVLASLHRQIAEITFGGRAASSLDPMHVEPEPRSPQVRSPANGPLTPSNNNTTTIQRKKKLPPIPIKVPLLPVFVLSLPKSGTTSTHKYFECGRHNSVHWGIKNDTKHSVTIGQCWGNNYFNDRPMMEGCASSKYQVYSDVGYVYQTKELANNTRDGHLNCFYPSVHGLDNIAKYYPKSTILLVTRNATAWADRVNHWSGIHHRWMNACDGFPKGDGRNPASLQQWIDFYNQHTANIRQFAKDHPSIRYIEIELESEKSGAQLEEAVGISKYCWGDCPPTEMAKCAERLAQIQREAETATE